MAAAASIKIVKTIPWKGGTQSWSNRYHFDGTTPADSTHWQTLADAITTAEKAIYAPWIHITDAVGYGPGSDVPVFSHSYTPIAGTGSFSGDVQAAEVVALCRFTTAKRSSKNHPVYLFNYWHGVYANSATENDLLLASQKTAMETYAAAWITGFSDGSSSHHRAGPDGTLATARVLETYLTHRDFR
jgi:hypothetical protein